MSSTLVDADSIQILDARRRVIGTVPRERIRVSGISRWATDFIVVIEPLMPSFGLGFECDPATIFGILDDPAGDWRSAVLAAEEITFSEADELRLKPLLRSIIDRDSRTDEPATRTAVASAVRKFVALLDPHELGAITELLDPRRSLPTWFEKEVAKMAARKLAAVTPTATDGLADALFDLFDAYANPRSLLKKYHGAAAFDAALAVTLLAERHADAVVTRVGRLDARWFRDSLAREARELSDALAPPRQTSRAALRRLADVAAAPLTQG